MLNVLHMMIINKTAQLTGSVWTRNKHHVEGVQQKCKSELEQLLWIFWRLPHLIETQRV
jgi:hypothetical protein